MGKVAAAAVAGLVAFTLLMILIGVVLGGGPNGLGGLGGLGAHGLPGVVCAPDAGGAPVASVAGFGPEQYRGRGR